MRIHSLACSALCAALLILTSGSLPGAEKISADRRLPGSVVLYVSCPDIPGAVEKFEETSFGAMLQDAAFDKFRGQLEEGIQEKSKELQEKLGVSLDDLKALAAGEVSLAVVRLPNEPLSAMLFLDIGENEKTLNALLEKGENSLEGMTLEKETSSVQGVPVTVCTVFPEGSPEKAQKFAFFIRDQMFVVGNSLPAIKGTITRWNGDQPKSLADSAVYKEIQQACRSSARTTPALTWFVDPVGLTTAAMAMVPAAQNAAVFLSANLPVVGLDKLKGIGGVQELATPEFDSISRTMIYVVPPPSGLLKVFELRPTITTIPQWIPAECAQCVATDWNVPGAYAAIAGIFDGMQGRPGAFDALTGSLRLPNGDPINVKTDVIEVLTGSVEGYTIAGDEGDEQDVYGVIAVGLTDPAKGKKLAESLLGLTGEITTEEESGVIWFRPGGESEDWVAAVKGTTFFAGNDEDLLKEALSGSTEKPLVGSEAYQLLVRQLPGPVSLLHYQNPFESLYKQYEDLRAGKFDGLAEGEIDFSTLPPADELEGYLPPAISYIIPGEHGPTHVSLSLKPAK